MTCFWADLFNKISGKRVHEGPINSEPALVQVMVWCAEQVTKSIFMYMCIYVYIYIYMEPALPGLNRVEAKENHYASHVQQSVSIANYNTK